MIIDMDDNLKHYGMPRRSGRYPWGSGEDPYQSEQDTFLKDVTELQKNGMSEVDIAKKHNMSTTELRSRISIAKNEAKKRDYYEAIKLRNKGMSYQAIADKLGMPNESSVRSLLAPSRQEKLESISKTADILKKSVDEKGYIDVGLGVETTIGVSSTKMNTAIKKLEDEGYIITNIPVEQLGTGKNTTVKVLMKKPEGASDSDISRKAFALAAQNKDKISLPMGYIEHETGKTKYGLDPIQSIDKSRVLIRYAEDGGIKKDGVIELRRNVSDLDLGASRYAQVRIGVDGTHYLKGMAMYTDHIPDGYDIIFNTNKPKGTPMLGPKDNTVLKPMKNDPDNPFGAAIKPGGQKGAINIVNEEGDWNEWSKTLSSQVLSKQSPQLAKRQLGIIADQRKDEYNDIMHIANPTIRRKLLVSFADGCDKDAIDLKAAALPRQSTHVILPIPNMKPNEIYAPKYQNGEEVVLIRYPHAGPFEIPRLIVNNKQKDARRLIFNAADAVGIHPSVAERLSGADFDGDSVTVIPTKNQKIKTANALSGLKDFEPKIRYAKYDGMPEVGVPKKNGGDGFNKGMQMGSVSNLITDMELHGADEKELARAVRHSMVVIDAEKHQLNWKQSEIDNGIKELKKKYQGRENAGASTLISKAKGMKNVDERKEWFLSEDTINPDGSKKYRNTNRTYINRNGKEVKYIQTITKMGDTDDAFTLSSGTRMESIYATHANALKQLANQARKSAVILKPEKRSNSAKEIYANEIISVRNKIGAILSNRPLERQAMLKSNVRLYQKMKDNDTKLSKDQKSKLRNQLLNQARAEVGSISKRDRNIDLTDREWEAIMANAFSGNELHQIVENIDLDILKKHATPRDERSIPASKQSLINSMNSNGYSLAEIADRVGVSPSTVQKYISR